MERGRGWGGRCEEGWRQHAKVGGYYSWRGGGGGEEDLRKDAESTLKQRDPFFLPVVSMEQGRHYSHAIANYSLETSTVDY